jgi:hypothetical protein
VGADEIANEFINRRPSGCLATEGRGLPIAVTSSLREESQIADFRFQSPDLAFGMRNFRSQIWPLRFAICNPEGHARVLQVSPLGRLLVTCCGLLNSVWIDGKEEFIREKFRAGPVALTRCLEKSFSLDSGNPKPVGHGQIPS